MTRWKKANQNNKATSPATSLSGGSHPSEHDKEKLEGDVVKGGEREEYADKDPDAEFGGTEARKVLEKRLLWKIDLRMSIMVVIYILNYVGVSFFYVSALQEGF